MARMIPMSPVDSRSGAEERLFERFASALPDPFVVLHSVKWLEKTKRGGPDRPTECEADFLILHPGLGALIVEVKGGRISFDAGTGTWRSESAAGIEYVIKDPFTQAQRSCHSLLRLVRSNPRSPTHWGPFGHAVAFPDGTLMTRPLAGTPPDLVLDAHAIADDARLHKAVRSSFAYWGKATMTGADGDRGVAALVDMVAHDLRIRDLLATRVDEADKRILELSKQQFRVLDYMRRNPRVAVAGCAGSGKTLLAAEKAQRLAQSGFRTLLTCFNRPLADHLREAIGAQEGLTVQNFHSLCARLAHEARIALEWPIRPADEPRFYERVLPNTLLKVSERMGPTFDALVIDEGQDFTPTWWEALSLLLEDPDRGIMYVFFDDNQSLYGRPSGLPSDLVNVELHENWRNTRPIHELVSTFYSGDPLVAMGPNGPPVEMVHVESEGLLRATLGTVLHRLCKDNNIAAEDIVVLTSRHLDAAAVVGKLGSLVVALEPTGPNQIKVSSIHRFKGLDAKVVVLIDVDSHRPDYGELMYVGCSRARSYLVVVGVAYTSHTYAPTGDGAA
jgi:hypothetical protein